METNVSNTWTLPNPTDFEDGIEMAIAKSQKTGRSFCVLIIQIQNIDLFKKRRSSEVVQNLLRELGLAARRVVHPSQFVGRFQDGIGFVFDAIDVGQVDVLAGKLSLLFQSVIKNGRYNDMTGRWSDIVYQFLHPNNPGMIYPRVGW